MTIFEELQMRQRASQAKQRLEQAKAEEVAAKQIADCRAKLGEVKTSLTRKIGAERGVSDYSVREIMYVYGVDRSTAYRWKKLKCRLNEEPSLMPDGKVNWAIAEFRKESKPGPGYRPRLNIIRQARSSVRCAINKLKKLENDSRYDRFPFDRDCLKMAWDVENDAKALAFLVEEATGYYDSEEVLARQCRSPGDVAESLVLRISR